jgi:hypothetical protein
MAHQTQTCPGCEQEIASDWCAACETHVSDWSTVTLAEWRERNPEIVAEVLADLQLTECHGDPLLRRVA